MVKKLWRYVTPFSSDTGMLRTDRQTDEHTEFLHQYRASVWMTRNLTTLSHGCIIILLVVCCISMTSSGFSAISWWDNEVSLRHVQNRVLVDVREFLWTASVRWSREFLQICVCERTHPPSTHLLWNLKPPTTPATVALDHPRRQCDRRCSRLATAARGLHVLTRLEEGTGRYVDQSEHRYTPLVGR